MTYEKYDLTADEQWPILVLRKTNTYSGHELPQRLVSKLDRAHKAVCMAEDEILRHAGIDPVQWRGYDWKNYREWMLGIGPASDVL